MLTQKKHIYAKCHMFTERNECNFDFGWTHICVYGHFANYIVQLALV